MSACPIDGRKSEDIGSGARGVQAIYAAHSMAISGIRTPFRDHCGVMVAAAACCTLRARSRSQAIANWQSVSLIH